MKHKYIPVEKQSKRRQKEYNSVLRKDWGGLNPVTRKVESAKVYNRKKSKQQWHQHEPGLDYFFSVSFRIGFRHSTA